MAKRNEIANPVTGRNRSKQALLLRRIFGRLSVPKYNILVVWSPLK